MIGLPATCSSSPTAAAIASRTPARLWQARLSITTTSPRRSVGTSCCRTYASNSSPVIAPSTTVGAVRPSARNAAMKVVVFQWPCGTGMTRRAPCGARP